ncbi:MAG: hypothetical protein Q8N26_21450 [Myxococcales bacterium]|nr:hypothetical protein [Myxococcales bacterium]
MVLTLVSEVLQTCNLAVASSHLDDAVTRGCSRPGATVGTTLLRIPRMSITDSAVKPIGHSTRSRSPAPW